MRIFRYLLLVVLVSFQLHSLAQSEQQPAELSQEVENVLLRRMHIDDPSLYEQLLAYSRQKQIPMQEIRDALINILDRSLEGNDIRQKRLVDFTVGVLKEFEGEEVVFALKNVVKKTRDTNLRRNAIRGIVCAETNAVLLYIKEVVEDGASYSDLDRLGLYEELFGRLERKTGAKLITKKDRSDIISFLKTHIQEERAQGNIIKLDEYLKGVDQNYRTSNARREMLRKYAGSDVEKQRQYFIKELQAFDKEDVLVSIGVQDDPVIENMLKVEGKRVKIGGEILG